MGKDAPIADAGLSRKERAGIHRRKQINEAAKSCTTEQLRTIRHLIIDDNGTVLNHKNYYRILKSLENFKEGKPRHLSPKEKKLQRRGNGIVQAPPTRPPGQILAWRAGPEAHGEIMRAFDDEVEDFKDNATGDLFERRSVNSIVPNFRSLADVRTLPIRLAQRNMERCFGKITMDTVQEEEEEEMPEYISQTPRNHEQTEEDKQRAADLAAAYGSLGGAGKSLLTAGTGTLDQMEDVSSMEGEDGDDEEMEDEDEGGDNEGEEDEGDEDEGGEDEGWEGYVEEEDDMDI